MVLVTLHKNKYYILHMYLDWLDDGVFFHPLPIYTTNISMHIHFKNENLEWMVMLISYT